ncbi:hypothetical protein Y032_0078g1164 [Ancylostoma ceylanicum]|nr:hypothetical protein Y032_0078g1164 [Ancylostoma ceylanicum]
MAEVYISGQIESADGFGDNRVCCRWSLQTGGGWRVVEGAVDGQTQTDLPSAFEKAYFAHPIDLHLATKTVQGWPRMQLQVWHHDVYGRQELVGYGSLFLPSTPGEHELVCNIWRPKGTAREEMMQRFVGGGIQVVITNDSETLVRPIKVPFSAFALASEHISPLTFLFCTPATDNQSPCITTVGFAGVFVVNT